MAEIHVQTKKQSSNPVWLWIVLALLVIGGIVYYLMTRNKQQPANPTSEPNAASQLYPQSQPPRPERVKIVIPVVYMRSV